MGIYISLSPENTEELEETGSITGLRQHEERVTDRTRGAFFVADEIYGENVVKMFLLQWRDQGNKDGAGTMHASVAWEKP